MSMRHQLLGCSLTHCCHTEHLVHAALVLQKRVDNMSGACLPGSCLLRLLITALQRTGQHFVPPGHAEPPPLQHCALLLQCCVELITVSPCRAHGPRLPDGPRAYGLPLQRTVHRGDHPVPVSFCAFCLYVLSGCLSGMQAMVSQCVCLK